MSTAFKLKFKKSLPTDFVEKTITGMYGTKPEKVLRIFQDWYGSELTAAHWDLAKLYDPKAWRFSPVYHTVSRDQIEERRWMSLQKAVVAKARGWSDLYMSQQGAIKRYQDHVKDVSVDTEIILIEDDSNWGKPLWIHPDMIREQIAADIAAMRTAISGRNPATIIMDEVVYKEGKGTEMSGIKTAAVCFEHDLRPDLGWRHSPAKRYHYKTDLDLSVGDYVIVESPTTGFTCVKVVEVFDMVMPNATKWVVTRVDVTEHKRRQERIKRKAEIERELDKQMKWFAENQLREMAAERNPVIRSLLDEKKALDD